MGKYKDKFTPYLSKESYASLFSIHKDLEEANAEHILFYDSANLTINFNNFESYQKIEEDHNQAIEVVQALRLQLKTLENSGDKNLILRAQEEFHEGLRAQEYIYGKLEEEMRSIRAKEFIRNSLAKINSQFIELLEPARRKAFIESRCLVVPSANNPHSRFSTIASSSQQDALKKCYESALLQGLNHSVNRFQEIHEQDPEKAQKMSKDDPVAILSWITKISTDTSIKDEDKNDLFLDYISGGYILQVATRIKLAIVNHPTFKEIMDAMTHDPETRYDRGRS